ncbi:hypothetical protein BH09VER1_BH09VER1_24800 [soil metagenome]
MTKPLPKKTIAVVPSKKGTPIISAIAEMDLPRLTESYHSLELAEQNFETLSGVVAVLRGLVLLEVKKKVGHGNFKAWVAKHENKSYRTITRATKAAVAFMTEAKSAVTGTFENAGGDLAPVLRSVDLEHPLVKAVLKWTDGRSATQLDIDLADLTRGGLKIKKDPELSAEEKYKLAVAQIHEDHVKAFTVLDSLTARNAYQALKDDVLHASIEAAETFLTAAKAWVNTPKNKRAVSLKIS